MGRVSGILLPVNVTKESFKQFHQAGRGLVPSQVFIHVTKGLECTSTFSPLH